MPKLKNNKPSRKGIISVVGKKSKNVNKKHRKVSLPRRSLKERVKYSDNFHEKCRRINVNPVIIMKKTVQRDENQESYFQATLENWHAKNTSTPFTVGIFYRNCLFLLLCIKY